LTAYIRYDPIAARLELQQAVAADSSSSSGSDSDEDRERGSRNEVRRTADTERPSPDGRESLSMAKDKENGGSDSGGNSLPKDNR
jgi:hypothetical protein